MMGSGGGSGGGGGGGGGGRGRGRWSPRQLAVKHSICELESNSASEAATSESPEKNGPFDICPPKQKQSAGIVLNPPLLVTNREKRNQTKGSSISVLRPGMVLLKGYLSLNDQVMIVNRCRDLGIGPSGFYEPGYREGTKLHLKMMCLGKHWDPQTCQYGDHRPFDGAKPHEIPSQFHRFVEGAIRDSNALTQLPHIIPDICIVNFYSQNGRLGLHQDKDESYQSLRQGLPVVSFSIGDSAEFLFGDDRDVDKAQKVQLDSGDVLIFGGSSRNVFHGVTAIHPRTAPNLLVQQTSLRPGRLNLTFRQY